MRGFLTGLGLVVLASLALLTMPALGGRDKAPNPPAVYELIQLDPTPAAFHGGPPPHEATDAAEDFRLGNGGQLRWDGAQAVPYGVDTNACTPNCDDVLAEVEAGFAAWADSGVRFNQVANPPNNECGIPNTISWVAIDGPGGTLAGTSVCYNRMTKEIVGFQIVVDSGDSWSDRDDAGGEFDIRAISAHEMGHGIGLQHVSAPRASRLTMTPAIAGGDQGLATLGCGDRLGVNALYGAGLDCNGLPDD